MSRKGGGVGGLQEFQRPIPSFKVKQQHAARYSRALLSGKHMHTKRNKQTKRRRRTTRKPQKTLLIIILST
jgi:hypothetical protein